MKGLETLDVLSLKALLNDLILRGWSESLDDKYYVSIPMSLIIIYKCGTCRQANRQRVFKQDMKNLNRFIACTASGCRKKAFASTIFVDQDIKKQDWFNP